MARRELCPKETCVGLIGTDGRCKECGTVGASQVADPRHQGMERPTGDGDVDVGEEDDDRVLCSDGGCVGLVGPDGLCKVCGAPGEALASRSSGPRPAPRFDSSPPMASGTDPEVEDDDDRELCPDGACLGLIGRDARCKVCGTPRVPDESGQA